MKLASEVGRINVCVLTDYDIDGINMWRNANEKMRINIKRIGITQDVVKWLHENGHDDIQLEDVEEEYTPNPKRQYEMILYRFFCGFAVHLYYH